mmetsp:Transcript_56470/g.156119  ORF Transcript_56470/g.156119 Transcript_56470/m.156119 type:complete len:243 (+) Transcript_56470:133-861(+)
MSATASISGGLLLLVLGCACGDSRALQLHAGSRSGQHDTSLARWPWAVRRRAMALRAGGDGEISTEGYTLATSETDGTGGWLQHRSAIDAVGSGPGDDWVGALVATGALEAATNFVPPGATLTHKPRVLVLYGSLRASSFSRKLALECARLAEVLGCDVRVFNPAGLPVRDPEIQDVDPKVQELRALSEWSEGHIWVSPEVCPSPHCHAKPSAFSTRRVRGLTFHANPADAWLRHGLLQEPD